MFFVVVEIGEYCFCLVYGLGILFFIFRYAGFGVYFFCFCSLLVIARRCWMFGFLGLRIFTLSWFLIVFV